jgi:hypothetical protein
MQYPDSNHSLSIGKIIAVLLFLTPLTQKAKMSLEAGMIDASRFDNSAEATKSHPGGSDEKIHDVRRQ